MRVRASAAIAGLAVSVACNSTPTSPNIISGASTSVTGFIAQFATVGPPSVAGVLHGGTVSVGNGSGPVLTSTGPNIAVSGGAIIIGLSSPTPFAHAFVSVGNTGSTASGGFYEIDLTAPAQSLQVLVTFASTFPQNVSSFQLLFQATDVNGNGSAATALTMTATASVLGSAPSILATYSPNPAPFLGGTNCTLSLQQGCLWEFDVILQEVNGVSVPSGTYTETFTFGTQTVTGVLNISIPAHGTATITRNLACGTGGSACATPAELAGGTYGYTITGTDQNGNAFSFTGPTLTLQGQGASQASAVRRR